MGGTVCGCAKQKPSIGVVGRGFLPSARPSGDVCPADVNAKIADVQIAVGDDIERFCAYERQHNDQLSGGHLEAQLRRFRRLWRVHFFIDRRTKANLGERLDILRRAIEKLVLGHLVNGEEFRGVARFLAVELTKLPGSPWYGASVLEGPAEAAYQDPSAISGTYPLGAPAIRSFIRAEGSK